MKNPKVWPFKSVKAKQYFAVVMFIILNNVVLSFEFVDEMLKCHHSNESY